MKSKTRTRITPRSGRPYMPGYEMMFDTKRHSLPWSWASKRMTSSHNYYLATTRPDGRPHVMPVWGVWLDNTFYFSTGVNSRKSRNLSLNSNCAVIAEKVEEAVIVEGVARRVTNRSERRRVVVDYKKKYDWDMSDSQDPVYRVTPALAFGIVENPGPLRANPTRWIFGNHRKVRV